MTKKMINQNSKFQKELIDTVDSEFIFGNKPINRFKSTENQKINQTLSKKDQIDNLKNKINCVA